jgi:hypothetical protein
MKHHLKLTLSSLLLIPIFAFSQTNKNYIQVGYSSICCGTPDSKTVVDFVITFENENKLKPFEIYIERGLGKEGEYAFYIGTDNLDSLLLNSFWEGLKMTATNQNKERSKNGDGYVNVDDKLTSDSTLKTIKVKPRTGISTLEIYEYKK